MRHAAAAAVKAALEICAVQLVISSIPCSLGSLDRPSANRVSQMLALNRENDARFFDSYLPLRVNGHESKATPDAAEADGVRQRERLPVHEHADHQRDRRAQELDEAEQRQRDQVRRPSEQDKRHCRDDTA